MWSSDPFEDELRLRFSLLDVPEPSTRVRNEATRRFRRWRLRRRLLVATPSVAAAAVLGGVLGLGGFVGTRDVIRLANYTFPLPPGFHLTAASTGPCRAVVAFRERIIVPPGSSPIGAGTISITKGKGPYHTAKIASAAGADGGCVLMALTDPFTPASETGNPSYTLTASPSARRVDVAGHVGWLTAARKDGGQADLQLTVELPQAAGQMRDLGVGASGLSANELLAIVSKGLS
ncbi:MAG: hypothetical protein ACYCSX_09285 [Acidimicrobiales bacterium]|jgi:hypothetical protein